VQQLLWKSRKQFQVALIYETFLFRLLKLFQGVGIQMPKALTIKPSANGSVKADIPKPFEIGFYKFFPCSFTKHTKNGLKFFLLCRGITGLWITESNSPKFRNKIEAQKFAETNKDMSIKPY